MAFCYSNIDDYLKTCIMIISLAFKFVTRRAFSSKMGKVWKLLEFSVVMFVVAGDATGLDFSMGIHKHNNGKYLLLYKKFICCLLMMC